MSAREDITEDRGQPGVSGMFSPLGRHAQRDRVGRAGPGGCAVSNEPLTDQQLAALRTFIAEQRVKLDELEAMIEAVERQPGQGAGT